jgi:hypothetical protein
MMKEWMEYVTHMGKAIFTMAWTVPEASTFQGNRQMKVINLLDKHTVHLYPPGYTPTNLTSLRV